MLNKIRYFSEEEKWVKYMILWKKNKFFFLFYYVGWRNFIWIFRIRKKFFFVYYFVWIGFWGVIFFYRIIVICLFCLLNRVIVISYSVIFSGVVCGVCCVGCYKFVFVIVLVVAVCIGGYIVVFNLVIVICILEISSFAVI